MWFTAPGILVLLLYVNPTVSKEVCSDSVIKDAILSLARIMRDNSQKLERHETRERHLGEYMKKAVGALSKKVSVVDTFLTHFTKIEDRISEIEQLISQRDERERIQIQKTANLIESLETRLEAKLTDMKNTIAEVGQRVELTEPTPTAESVSASDIISKLNDTEARFLERIARIESRLDNMAEKSKEEAVERAEKLQTIFTKRADEKERIQKQETEKLIKNLENHLDMRLAEINDTIHEVNDRVEPTQPTPTTESVTPSDIISKLNDTEAHFLGKVAQIESRLDSMATKNKGEATAQAEKLQTLFTEVQSITGKLGDIESALENARQAARKEAEKPEKPEVDIEAIMEEQSKALGKVTELVENTVNRIQDLPTTSEVLALHNETQAALQETKYTLQNVVDDQMNRITTNVSENNEEIKHSVEALRSDLANNAEHVNAKLRDLVKAQVVMVSTADQVLDIKKRLEYGFHQILLEVSELINSQGTVMNDTLNERFDKISSDIIGNHTTALANLTNKMENDLNQVWRQITVMYQQITESTRSLDKLNQQSEDFINDTISTMDGMANKVFNDIFESTGKKQRRLLTVTDIKKQMGDVEGNLNFLLGRLHLVTEEFKKIKTDLVSALNDIRASFKEVKEAANDLSHPGRHPIPEGHQEPDDARNNSDPSLQKRKELEEFGHLPAN